MAVSADGFGISCAFWFGGMLIVFALFGYFRRLGWTEKFYQKKYFFTPDGFIAPPYIGKSSFWPKAVVSVTERKVLASSGMDSLVYLKSLRFSLEVFLMVTFFTCAVILPINLTGDNVDNLTSSPYDPSTVSEFIQWYLPGLDGTALNETEAEAEVEAVKTIEAPEIYNKSIGSPPPGLLWWERLPDVPALPTVESVFGPAYENYTWIYDDNYKVVQYDLTALDKTTMTNVEKRSSSLYAHAIMSWWLTLLVLWRLGAYSRQVLNLRLLYFKEGSGIQGKSILCTDIPLSSDALRENGEDSDDGDDDDDETMGWFQRKFGKTMDFKKDLKNNKKSDDGDALGPQEEDEVEVVLPDRWTEATDLVQGRGHSWLVDHEFTKLYGENELKESVAVYNTAKLTTLCQQYEKTKEGAFHAVDLVVTRYMDEKKRQKMKKRMAKTVIGKTMGKWGTEKYGLKPVKVDTFEFYVDRLQYLREEILKEQALARKKPLPCAFVSFNNRRTQVIASQTMMCEDLSAWVTGPAPGPGELVWGNLRMRKRERETRSLSYTALFWILMAFYMIPVTAVQVLLSSNSLVGFLETIPIASALLTGIIPGLALRIFIIILPMILSAMLLKIKGVVSESELDRNLVSGMYVFEFITVFLTSFIAGTFANQFQEILDDPGSIVQVFGTAAPQVGIFFFSYILTIACWEIPLNIFDAVGLILYHLKLKLASTARSKTKVNESKKTFDFGAMIPDDGIIFLLGMSFSVASPLIAPIALLYYGVRYLVNKHNLTYRAELAYDSGGQFWLAAFNQYVTGLVAFQLLMIFMLAIKESIGPPIIVAPLPLLTIFWALSTKADIKKPFAYQSLLMAEDLDTKESQEGKRTSQTSESYMDPVFCFDEEDHNVVISQCKVLKNAQADEVWPNELIATLADDFEMVGSDGSAFHDVEEQ
jgi:hypothetical protein